MTMVGGANNQQQHTKTKTTIVYVPPPLLLLTAPLYLLHFFPLFFTMLPEERIKKLAKLPSNCTCPNCGTTKKFGFGTVCMLSLAFVCNECKSSHQAISHRCKSLTMSSWTEAEVLQITKAGNDVCRATWLAKAPPCGSNGRPQPGMDIMVYKRFIEAAYERKLFYSNDGETVPQQTRAAPAPTPVHVAAPAPAPAPVVADLLDFGNFETAGPAEAPSNDIFATAHDSFGDFASANSNAMPASAVPVSHQQQVSNSTHVAAAATAADPFADFSGFATSTTVSNNNNTSGAFHSSWDAAPAPAPKKPVMLNTSQNANAISAMGLTSAPTLQVPNNSSSNMMMMQQQQQQMYRMMMMMQQQQQQPMTSMMPPSGNFGMMAMPQQNLPMQQQSNSNNMMNMNMNMNMNTMQSSMTGGGMMMNMQPSMNNNQQSSSSRQPQQQTPSSKPDPFANLF
jgi:hypothetical protein